MGAIFGDLRLPDRFWSKIEKQGECWTWTACRVRGYGQLGRTRTRKSDRAHRLAYEVLVGPIPEGLTIDHLCRNRACVNPAHMEPVTNRVNLLRGIGITAENARKTECVHGHPLSGDNLHIEPNGGRRCRTCDRLRRAEYRREYVNLRLEA